jgi:hypothetical protein
MRLWPGSLPKRPPCCQRERFHLDSIGPDGASQETSLQELSPMRMLTIVLRPQGGKLQIANLQRVEAQAPAIERYKYPDGIGGMPHKHIMPGLAKAPPMQRPREDSGGRRQRHRCVLEGTPES